MDNISRRTVLKGIAGTSALALGSGVVAAHGGGTLEDVPGWHGRLNSVRNATKKYQDYRVALQDGYVNTQHCISSPAGGMGIHFVNEGLIGDGEAQAHTPEVLLYEPVRNENDEIVDYTLVGLEYMVVAALVDETPAVEGLGLEMHGPMPGHGPGEPEHYDLHLWAWRTNPSGMLAEFNPDVEC